MLGQADKALRNKMYKDAQRLYKASLEKDENIALSYLGLSITSYHLREYQNAQDYALKALEIREDLPGAHLILAYIYAQKGSFLDAEKEVNKALEFSPEDPDALAFGGGVLAALQRVEDARTMLYKARTLDPDYWMIYYNLGSADLLEKKYREAVREYLKSFYYKKSFSTLGKILVIGLNIYLIPISIIFGALTLIAFSLKSLILLLVPTTPIILVGLLALLRKERKRHINDLAWSFSIDSVLSYEEIIE